MENSFTRDLQMVQHSQSQLMHGSNGKKSYYQSVNGETEWFDNDKTYAYKTQMLLIIFSNFGI